MVNAYIWHHHGQKVVALNANYLGKLARGQIRWPGRPYREALRAILGVPTDAALGFVNARRAVVRLEDVDRKQFICSSTALGASAVVLGPVAALLVGSEPTPVPLRVGATDIEQTRAAAQMFKSWDSAYGGWLTRDAVLAQVRWSAGLLKATCPDLLRPDLFSAVGYLAHTAGYIAFDAHAHDQVRRLDDDDRRSGAGRGHRRHGTGPGADVALAPHPRRVTGTQPPRTSASTRSPIYGTGSTHWHAPHNHRHRPEHQPDQH